MEQPVFRPQPGQLDRKVGIVFPDRSDAEMAMALLDAYEPVSGVDPDRVRFAALYLSRGSLDRLALALDTARIDWRDVLAPAEYRAYLDLPLDADRAAREAAMAADWERYSSWAEGD